MALIRAAGGLVWRPADSNLPGERLVCLVHRPRYDDWSLPKGKLEPGEHPLAAAVREVAEEARVDAVPQLPLPPARYSVEGGDKLVDYWAMTLRSATREGEASAVPTAEGSEVDGVMWLPAAPAIERVTHPRDAALLRTWVATPPVTGVVLLVRHADAGERAGWSGADNRRPLSDRGVADAAAIGRLLQLCGPTRLVSASPLRCQQTLTPLATASGLPVEVDSRFDEAGGDSAAAGAQLLRLASTGGTTVICSQGAMIPPLLARLAETGHPGEAAIPRHRSLLSADEAGRRNGWETAKGDTWLLPFSGPLPLALAPLRIADGASGR